MENQIIDVEYEDGIISIAKIIKDHGSEYDIATLRYYGDDEWNFDMEDGSISGSKVSVPENGCPE